MRDNQLKETANTVNLIERNACLDVQVFWNENFDYKSKSFELLQKAVKGKRIKLFVTDIIDREIRASIHKLVKAAQNAIHQTGKNTRILINHPSLIDFIRFRDQPFRDSVETNLIAQYEKFLADAKVSIIKTHSVPTGLIMDRYFKHVGPFEHREEKKSEFPDAISLEGLAQWCNAKATAMYIVSGDKGVQKGCQYTSSPHALHPVETLDNLLAMIARSEDAFATDVAPEAFRSAIPQICASIETEFPHLGFYLEDQNGDVGDTIVKSVVLDESVLINIQTEDTSSRLATFEVYATVNFTVKVEYDDPDASYYDREEQTTHVFNRIERDIAQTAEIAVQVDIEFDVDNPQIVDDVEVTLDRLQNISVFIEEF